MPLWDAFPVEMRERLEEQCISQRSDTTRTKNRQCHTDRRIPNGLAFMSHQKRTVELDWLHETHLQPECK